MASAYPNGDKKDDLNKKSNAKPTPEKGKPGELYYFIDKRHVDMVTKMLAEEDLKEDRLQAIMDATGLDFSEIALIMWQLQYSPKESSPNVLAKNPLTVALLAQGKKMQLHYSGHSNTPPKVPNSISDLLKEHDLLVQNKDPLVQDNDPLVQDNDPPVPDNLPAELSSGVEDLILRESSRCDWPATHPIPVPTADWTPSKGARARTVSSQGTSYNLTSTSRESSPATDEVSRYLSSTCQSSSSSPSKKARIIKSAGYPTQTEPLDLSPVKKYCALTDSRDSLCDTGDCIESGEQILSSHDHYEASADNAAQSEPLDYSNKKRESDVSDEEL